MVHICELGCSPPAPTDGYGTVLFVSLESINLSILLHAAQRHGDKADGGEQFIIHPAPGLHAPQLPQDGGELVTQGLVNPGIALHHNVPVQKSPGDVVLFGQPGQADGKLGNDVFLMIESFPIPVIAAVNGFALGGGNELAMSCDIRICSDNAVFGQPEVGLGITPGFGGTQRLARLVGMGMAKQLVYSALNIKADEAYRIGLVNAVYPQAELMENVLKLAGKIAKNAPIAVRNCKKAINNGISLPIEKAVEVEEKLFGACFETHDQQEGMACFLSREKPKPKAVFTNN